MRFEQFEVEVDAAAGVVLIKQEGEGAEDLVVLNVLQVPAFIEVLKSEVEDAQSKAANSRCSTQFAGE